MAAFCAKQSSIDHPHEPWTYRCLFGIVCLHVKGTLNNIALLGKSNQQSPLEEEKWPENWIPINAGKGKWWKLFRLLWGKSFTVLSLAKLELGHGVWRAVTKPNISLIFEVIVLLVKEVSFVWQPFCRCEVCTATNYIWVPDFPCWMSVCAATTVVQVSQTFWCQHYVG